MLKTNTLKDLIWRLEDIYEMLVQRNYDGVSYYNLDEFSTPTKNLKLVLELIQKELKEQSAPDNQWLIRKEPGTKDTYYTAEGALPDDVLAVYGIVK